MCSSESELVCFRETTELCTLTHTHKAAFNYKIRKVITYRLTWKNVKEKEKLLLLNSEV